MSVTAKEAFDFYQRMFVIPVDHIEEDKDGDVIVYLKGHTEWMDGDPIKITWPDDTKRYPLPEPEYMSVPACLKEWTPDKLYLFENPHSTRAEPKRLFCLDDGPLPFITDTVWDSMCDYHVKYVGKIYDDIPDKLKITVADVKKMNPDELRHIAGYYYKDPTEESTPTMESLGIDSKEVWSHKKVKWFAINSNGLGYCHAGKRPKVIPNYGWGFEDTKFYANTIGSFVSVQIPPGVDWKKLIWKRPKNQ